MDAVNDLDVIDALQVDRGHAEVGVTKLALDHVQRHTFRAGHVDATSAAIDIHEAFLHIACSLICLKQLQAEPARSGV